VSANLTSRNRLFADILFAISSAVVAPKAITICGSDIHYCVHGRIGDFVVNEPMVLGHETAAVVTKGEFNSFLDSSLRMQKTYPDLKKMSECSR
jgi:hypothetical protein